MELPVWKQEPASPPSDGLAAVWLPLDDDTFYRDEFDVKFEGDLLACETKAEVASQILENLESLVDLDELIKEEPCFLLDEKMLPMLNEVEAPRAVPVKPEFVPGKTQTYTIGDFETVYDAVGLGLTPPQSPPAEGHVLASLEPQRTIIAPQQPVYTDITNSKAIYSVPDRQLAFGDVISYQQQQPVVITVPPPTTPNYRNVGTPQPDIAHELAIVDELLRTRVKDLQWNSETSGPSSPESSSNSNFGDCSSSSEDPEWAPEPHDPAGPLKGSSSIKRARHSKPYSRAPTEDKKSRKKEQNKNAATRYRLKKKAEAEEILTEERKLQDINTDLGAKITDLNREIKYLKGLMRDLFKAKDPEWAPGPHDPAGPLKGSSSIKRARHSKPYSRAPTKDKKSRKKEQNKNAATLYPLKKKTEAEEILTEEHKLQDINTDLGAKITDLNREIKYLKGLMRDLFKAKGLID